MTLTPGGSQNNIPLVLDKDAVFLCRGVKIGNPSTVLGVQFRDPYGNFISDDYEPPSDYSGFSAQGVEPGCPPRAIEPEIECPAGSNWILNLKDLDPPPYPVDLNAQGITPAFRARQGPWSSASGTRFLIAQAFPLANFKFHAFSSTDKGVTWVEQDAANAPATVQASAVICAHPTDPTRLCVIYPESGPTVGSPGLPVIMKVIEFSMTTGLWGPTYGGGTNFPWTARTPFLPFEVWGAVSRPTVGDIVVVARTSNGTHEKIQYCSILPGGAWGAGIDAFPTGAAADEITTFMPAHGTLPVCVTATGFVYTLIYDNGPGRNELVQGKLSPANVVSNVDIIPEKDVPTGDEFDGSGGFAYVAGRVFLVLDKLAGDSSTIWTDWSWCVDGADITGWPNLPRILDAQVPLPVPLFGTQFWIVWLDGAGKVWYQVVDPTTTPPSVTLVKTDFTTVFPGILAVPDEMYSLTSIGAYTVSRFYFENPLGPPPAPPAVQQIAVTLRGVKRFPGRIMRSSCEVV